MFRPLLLSGLLLLAGVSCAEEAQPNEAVGDLRVITHTTGPNFDSDDYTLFVTNNGTTGITANDTITYAGLPIDDYSVNLGDVEGTCVVADGQNRTPYVTMGVTTVQFFITCS